MTMPIEEIQVVCPKCSTQFKSFYRGSFNQSLGDFDQKYIKKMTTAKCPSCKLKIDLGCLEVTKDGTWKIR